MHTRAREYFTDPRLKVPTWRATANGGIVKDGVPHTPAELLLHDIQEGLEEAGHEIHVYQNGDIVTEHGDCPDCALVVLINNFMRYRENVTPRKG